MKCVAWCSEVNLVVKRIPLKCKQCRKRFSSDSNQSNYCTNHICFGGTPDLTGKGIKKYIFLEKAMTMEDNLRRIEVSHSNSSKKISQLMNG